MSDEERRKILQMIEEGHISAEEGMRLIEALGGDTEPPEVFEETQTGYEAESGYDASAEYRVRSAKFRKLWQIPLWIGIIITVLGATWMFSALDSSGMSFWFFCAWLPFLLGVGVIALAWNSRRARWLYVKVEQKPGEHPRQIHFGFPLPIRLTSWGLRNFGHYAPEIKGVQIEELLHALDETADGPLIVNVDEGDDGARVQVFIG